MLLLTTKTAVATALVLLATVTVPAEAATYGEMTCQSNCAGTYTACRTACGSSNSPTMDYDCF